MSETWEEKSRLWIKQLFGDTNDKRVKLLQDYVIKANALEPAISKLDDEDLKRKTAEFKQVIDNALKGVENVSLMPPDAPKMPGQMRFSHDKILAQVLEEMMPEAF